MIVYLEHVKSTQCDQKVSGQYFFLSDYSIYLLFHAVPCAFQS